MGFNKSGITCQDQQKITMEERIKDLYIAHDNDDFMYLEKENLVSYNSTKNKINTCQLLHTKITFSF